MANPEVAEYIRNLSYDPAKILSVVEDGTTVSKPDVSREGVSDGVIVITKIQHSLKKSIDETAILSPAAAVMFPGALVRPMRR